MKDIIDEIDSRIKSPLFGYFLFSLVALNWGELFYLLLDNASVTQRIEHFNNGTDTFTLFIYPFLIASGYAIAYPWLHYLFMLLSTKPTELKNSLQAESEHKLLSKKQDLEEARSEILKSAETELIDRAKRDIELAKIEDINVREKLQSEIEEFRKERDDMRIPLDEKTKGSSLSKEQEEIIKLITANGGSMSEQHIINNSNFDKVKTEYYLEDLLHNNYLKENYNMTQGANYYDLTTKSKKLMVEKGVAK